MHKLEYTIKALSPIVHTEESQSNISNLFRLPLVGQDGDVYTIPVIKGNSIRGLLRNLICDYLFSECGISQSANLEKFHFFFAGGFLDGSEIGITLDDRREFRKLFPELSIFGAAMGNKMLRGKMQVGFMIPHCKELGSSETSIYDMTSIIRHTRQDDEKDVFGEQYVKKDNDLKNSQQMFYDIETINTSTFFSWTVSLDCTELELSAFSKCINLLKSKPYIGGKSSAGYGHISIETNTSISPELYEKHVASKKEEIKRYLEESY